MKVVHINTYDTGGAANAAIRLHLGLIKEGIDSCFLSLYKSRKDIPKHIEFNSAYQRIDFQSLQILTLKNYIKNKFNPTVKQAQSLKQEQSVIRHHLRGKVEHLSFIDTNYLVHKMPEVQKADIIHLHWISDFVNWSAFFPQTFNKPVVWTLHDENPFLGLFHYSLDDSASLPVNVKKINEKIRQQKIEILENHRQLVPCSPSKWLASQASASRALGNFNIHHIFNGLDLDVFRVYSQELARELFNIPKSHIVLLFVSQSISNKRKGFDLLIDALSQIDIDYKKVSIVAVGKPSDESMDFPIHYTGTIHDEKLMALLYNAADAFILPSREDNLPNTMLESIACGTPVISFPIGGVPDMVIPNLTGILAKELSAKSLAMAINQFIADPSVFKKEAIRAFAEEHFSLANQAKQYIQLYKSL